MISLAPRSWEKRDTTDKGRGIFTTKEITKGTVVGYYVGKIVQYVDVDLEKYRNYLMYYDDTSCIIPDLSKPGAHLINHSCSPNCWMYPDQGLTSFIAIKDVAAGEELTIHYLYPPLEKGCPNCTHQCKCESVTCRGTMHTEKRLYKKWHMAPSPLSFLDKTFGITPYPLVQEIQTAIY